MMFLLPLRRNAYGEIAKMGDVADLTAKAYEITRLIPYGMVTSYGDLAR
jgi:hypothetical protein